MSFQQISGKMLAEIVDTLSDAVFLVDAEGNICSCNAAAIKLFGYEASELMGENIAMLMPQPHRNLHNRYMQRYYETGEAHIIGFGRVVTAMKKDGSTFSGHLAVSEHFADGNRIFSGVIRDQTNDIARRLELELQLIESSLLQQSLSALIHSKDPAASLGEIIDIICKTLVLPGGCGWVRWHDGERASDIWVSKAEDPHLEPVIDKWLLTLDTKSLPKSGGGNPISVIHKDLPSPSLRGISIINPSHSLAADVGWALFMSGRCPSLTPYSYSLNSMYLHWIRAHFLEQ